MGWVAFAAAAKDMTLGATIVLGAIAAGIAIGFAVGRWLL